MPDTGGPREPYAELAAFARSILDLGGFQPPVEQLPVEQLPAIRGYLAEIQAAIQLLPEISAVDDQLDVSFDPAWPETES